MSENGPLGPKYEVVDGLRYDYERRIVEMLRCLTCQAEFWIDRNGDPQKPSVGTWLVPKDHTGFCPGCREMQNNSNAEQIIERESVN